MEISGVQQINRNISNLLLNTTITTGFLACFEQAGLFHVEDIETITSQCTSMGRARKFYDLITTRCGSYAVLLQSLEATSQTGALHILLQEDSFPSQTTPGTSTFSRCGGKPTGITFNVKAPLPTFTGRTAELAKLHERLTSADSSFNEINASRIVTITGLGGVGKTQLCRRYAQLYAKSYYNKNVIWLSGDSEKNLNSDFLSFVKHKLKLKLDESAAEEVNEELVQQVYSFLSDDTNNKCLIIFDNVEKGSYLKSFFSFLSGGFAWDTDDIGNLHFILTSREAIWEKQYKVMTLQVLNEGEATEMVRSILGSVKHDENLKLVNHLQCLPLAIHQAAAYIKEGQLRGDSYGIPEYLQDYQLKQEECLSFFDSEGCTLQFNDYNYTVLTSWQITIDRILEQEGGTEAVKVLEFIAYLNPDNISIQLLNPLFDDICSLKRGVRLLVRYSLVNVGEQFSGEFWSVHRLVQEVMRIQLRRKGEEEQRLKELLTHLGNEVKLNVDNLINIWSYVGSKYPQLASDFAHLNQKIASELILMRRVTPVNAVCRWGIGSTTVATKSRNFGDRIVSTVLARVGSLISFVKGRLRRSSNRSDTLSRFIREVIGDVELEDDQVALMIFRSKSPCTLEMLEEMFREECMSSDGAPIEVLYMLALFYLQNGEAVKSLGIFLEAYTYEILYLDEFDAAGFPEKVGLAFLRSLNLCPSTVIIRVLGNALKYLVSRQGVQFMFNGESELGKLEAEFYGMLGTALSDFGYHKNAILVLSFTLRHHRRICHLDSLHTLLRLADAFRRAGELKKSVQFYIYIYEQCSRRCGGEDSEFIFEVKLGLSQVLSERGKFGEALVLLEKLYDDLTCKFGMSEEYYVQMVNVLRAKAMAKLGGRDQEALHLLKSVPSRFGDRIGWQFLKNQHSIAKEIRGIEGRLKNKWRLLSWFSRITKHG